MAKTQTLIGVPGIEFTSPRFRKRLVEIAKDLEVNPDYLATAISFETQGTFSPTIRSPSGCVGLIQFCDDAAVEAARSAGLSMSADEAQNWLSGMSATDQLIYVQRYLANNLRGLKNPRLVDFYLSIFAPAYVGRPESQVVYEAGSANYAYNKGMDQPGPDGNKDGKITVAEIASRIGAVYQSGLGRPRVIVETAPVASPVTGKEDTIKWFVGTLTFVAMGSIIGYTFVTPLVEPYLKPYLRRAKA